ncbi:MAG: polysaccharide export protein, BexD/CtrA/VexA family protein [Bacteroidetes bacterium]|nr:polysaccharide export protein, BexD/CtrA/VexA family protein [Bacteroidota bacterium]
MKMSKLYILILGVMSFTVTSCYNYRSIGMLQDKNRSLPVYPKAEYADYKLRVNDEIIYRLITSDETISRLIATGASAGGGQNILSYRIYPDGTVDLPFIKSIRVGGLTLKEASQVIETRFRELIPDAVVKVSMANKTFTVIGEAGTGVYVIDRDRFTIYQALSMSGELKHSGDFKHVKILREGDKGTEVLEFDIRSISVVESKYYYIYPNDIIYVQRAASSFYKVENSWSSFMTVITSTLSLLFTVLYFNKN